MLYSCGQYDPASHACLTHAEIARRVASIKRIPYLGEFDRKLAYGKPLYFVPTATLLADEAGNTLAVTSEHDLFGGVVPHPFMTTKAITHDLLPGRAAAPQGWSSAFPRLVGANVLPGFAAFNLDDARKAGRQLLKRGAVRVKKTSGAGGLGQTAVTNTAQLDAYLFGIEADEIQRGGVVLEMNLSDVVTYSVGRACLGGILATYCGTQQLTTDNHGAEVYGGSKLLVVRGGFDKLERLELDAAMRTAIRQACAYHAAVRAVYPGFLASRANYDVARGLDDAGQWHSGVLEQSWRIGGATAAELQAIAAFQADPALEVVRASTVEIYRADCALPGAAVLHYQGFDEHAGALSKYSFIESYGDT